MSLVARYVPACAGLNQARGAFLIDSETGSSASFRPHQPACDSSDEAMSEDESFVSESSDELDSDSDLTVGDRWDRFQQSDDSDALTQRSGWLNSTQCVINGEYSSSSDENIDAIDADLPQIDLAEEIEIESVCMSETEDGISQDAGTFLF